MALEPTTEVKEIAAKDGSKQAKKVEPKTPPVVYVQCVQGRGLRHPITNQLFRPGVPLPVIDLDHPDNVFVRHQLAANIFELVDKV